MWNRFASLRDPAVWDAYIVHKNELDGDKLLSIDFVNEIDTAIVNRDVLHYWEFLRTHGLESAFDYQMHLVASTYPGWRVLLYHDVAQALTRSGPCEKMPEVELAPVSLLPRAISELGGRYYQADLHPETRIGDANFLDHTHRGLTTGQTGVIGSGCHILPCTLGGLSERVQQRHPIVGDHVHIGTDAGIFGPVRLGDRSSVGANTEIYGFVEIGTGCRIGTSVILGTIRTGQARPGTIRLGAGVRVGDGSIIENSTELGLSIPDDAVVPPRSHLVNDGFGQPRIVGE